MSERLRDYMGNRLFSFNQITIAIRNRYKYDFPMILMIIGKGAKENRRGELTSTQLILLILAIAGFVVILLFILAFNSGTYTEDEVCKLSVLTRATSPQAVNDYVPLKCTTKKLCLTDGSGKCEVSFAGENPEVIKLPSNRNDSLKKIEETSANAMYDCWNMMGQGKLDLFNGGIWKSAGLTTQDIPVCVICSRIGYDVKEETLSDVDLAYYLSHTKVPGGSITYTKAFTDPGMSSYAGADTDSLKNLESNEKLSLKVITRDSKTGLTSKGTEALGVIGEEKPRRVELAVVFTQIKVPKSYWDQLNTLLGTGIALAGTSFIMAPGTTSKAIGAAAGHFVITGIAAGGVVAYSMYNVYAGKVAAAGYCDKFTTSKEDTAGGCSGVQIIPYDVKAINSICGGIEGNP